MPVTAVSSAKAHDVAHARCERFGLSRQLEEPALVRSDAVIDQRRQDSGLEHVAQPVWDAFSAASSLDQVLILTDPTGDILWRFGTRSAMKLADRIGFVEGAAWRESSVGTNAISQVVRTETPGRVTGVQHFAHSHQGWTCMAAPIMSKNTGKMLGILDISGPCASLGEDVVGMVEFTARLTSGFLEQQPPGQMLGKAGNLAARESGRRATSVGADGLDAGSGLELPAKPQLRLRLLGARPAVRVPGREWQPIPLRVAEILALLLGRRRGYSAAELAAELYGDYGTAGAVRTDIHRVRRYIGEFLCSQPYRLAEEAHVCADVSTLEDHLAAGDVDAVLDSYDDLLLGASDNERIAQWRAWLDCEISELILRSGTTEQKSRFRRIEHVWEAELDAQWSV